MRLTESIHWVACGYVGPFFTNAGDCNVYLLHGPKGYVMIDSGGGKEPELIERQLRWDGVKLDEIKAILLTHPHIDHAAGANYWRKKCGAQVVAPEGCAEYLRKGGPYSPPSATGAPKSVIEPTPVDRTVGDGETFELAGLKLRAIAAPGHCPSMLCYRVDLDGLKVLVTGDCFYWGGKCTIFSLHDSDRAVFKQTLERLDKEEFDAFLGGHRFPVLHGAKEHLKLAIEEITRQIAGEPPMRA